MQVLQLTPEQIAMLPPEQRQSILILKEQIQKTASGAPWWSDWSKYWKVRASFFPVANKTLALESKVFEMLWHPPFFPQFHHVRISCLPYSDQAAKCEQIWRYPILVWNIVPVLFVLNHNVCFGWHWFTWRQEKVTSYVELNKSSSKNVTFLFFP